MALLFERDITVSQQLNSLIQATDDLRHPIKPLPQIKKEVGASGHGWSTPSSGKRDRSTYVELSMLRQIPQSIKMVGMNGEKNMA